MYKFKPRRVGDFKVTRTGKLKWFWPLGEKWVQWGQVSVDWLIRLPPKLRVELSVKYQQEGNYETLTEGGLHFDSTMLENMHLLIDKVQCDLDTNNFVRDDDAV